jgi:hypothetical protein
VTDVCLDVGFRKKHDIPVGSARWLTVVSPEGPDDLELVLEPNGHPAASAYTLAIFSDTCGNLIQIYQPQS